jgi:hypothetical protein
MRCLRELREILHKGGGVVIDIFNRELLMLKFKANWRSKFRSLFLLILLKWSNRFAKRVLFQFFKWKEYPSFFLLQKRTVNRSGNRLFDLWVVCDKSTRQIKIFRHIARLYELNSLEGLLAETGFVVKRVYGDYDGGVFISNSSRLILFAIAK